jgi:hypothetical protein
VVIPAERFIVRSTEHDAWLEARRGGVSATAVAAAATPAGFRDTVNTWGESIEPNGYMLFGQEAEPELMRYAHRVHGILPSDWLIAGEDPRHLATPDGLSPDHRTIAEAKTTGKDWGDKVPIKYRRQVQWQLSVTGAERCLFLWHLRADDDNGWFYMPWLEPKTLWIERDEDEIARLRDVADRLIGAVHGELQGAA